MTTTTPKLTPKQEQVHKLLGEGLTPAQIAKRMKVKSTSIYGHMSRMRKLGVQLPSETLATNGNGNGHHEPATEPAETTAKPTGDSVLDGPINLITTTIAHCDQQRAELDEQLAAVQARAGDLIKQKEAANAERERLASALRELKS